MPGQLLAVVFDFNGVIIDDERLHYLAFVRVLAEEGGALSEADYFCRYLGIPDRELLALLMPGASPAAMEDLFARKAAAYLDLLDEGYRLFPGAADLIRDLSAHLPLAICSGALAHEIDKVLELEGLHANFKAIVSAEDVTHGKPHPAPYLEAARRLGIAPTACLAIEDAPGGIQSAKDAGMYTIGIPTSTSAEALGEADLVVESVAELSLKRLRAVVAQVT